ncbi:hypothetical protein [Glacieibacterium frigidum]|uniref:Uncharacterized protein n=1 Tax=Glacieibacterium frigidum TaxID=2593303 RepID=A0A552UHT6_9SPHN|nr:hypothetical protein [Glacieibacterium frigidum]TRW17784.1 hypothetical protein FMM06_06510 [Glacieibacterium frigidum]
MSRVGAVAIVPVALLAAAAAPAGWVERAGQGPGVVYDSKAAPMTSVIVFPPNAVPGFGAETLRKLIGRIPVCPVAGRIDAPAGEGSLRLIAGAADRRCIVQARQLTGGEWRVVLGMASGRGAMAESALLSAVGQFAGTSAARRPSTTLPAPVGTQAPGIAASVPAGGRLPQPVGAVIRGASSFVGYPPMMTFTNTPWFLFPGGIATDCTQVAPGAPPTLAMLRARKDCTGGRWRRAGGKIALQVEDGDPWITDMVHELAPVPRGTRLDFRGQTKSGAGFDNAMGGGSTSTTSYGGFTLTADGRIETSMSSSVNFSSSSAVAYAGGRKQGVRGRYEIDGYVLRVALDGGPVTDRYVLFDKGGKPTYGHVYFEGRQYWLPRR